MQAFELKNYGIRLDSGDLAYLSKEAYKMLDEAGFDDAVISASSDLDEYLIDQPASLRDAKIDSWGVGTTPDHCQGQSCLSEASTSWLLYRDPETQEFIPKIKLV